MIGNVSSLSVFTTACKVNLSPLNLVLHSIYCCKRNGLSKNGRLYLFNSLGLQAGRAEITQDCCPPLDAFRYLHVNSYLNFYFTIVNNGCLIPFKDNIVQHRENEESSQGYSIYPEKKSTTIRALIFFFSGCNCLFYWFTMVIKVKWIHIMGHPLDTLPRK